MPSGNSGNAVSRVLLWAVALRAAFAAAALQHPQLTFLHRELDILNVAEMGFERGAGLLQISERSLYSGYVFINFELDTPLQHLIQSLPRVSGFIGEANHPTPLSEKDINTILDRVENRAAPKPKVFFENGEMVRIIDGPFANFTGTVDEYDLEHGTLKLNVSIFGRSTPVDIAYTQVEKII